MVKKRTKKVKRTKRKASKLPRNFFLLTLLMGLVYLLYRFYNRDHSVKQKEALTINIPSGFQGFGIDVSHHQGVIDWDVLLNKEGYDTLVDFVYCKATEGSTFVDSEWYRNRKELMKREIPHGAYHFFRPSVDPEEQAKHFLYHWTKQEGDLPPVLDIETEGENDKQLIKSIDIWMNAVEQRTGMRPIIYTSLHFFETKFAKSFPNHSFWIAAYSRKPGSIDDPRIIHWQYSESGSLPGIETAVDLNVTKLPFQRN